MGSELSSSDKDALTQLLSDAIMAQYTEQRGEISFFGTAMAAVDALLGSEEWFVLRADKENSDD